MAALLSKAAKDGDVDTVAILMKENPGVVDKQHDGWTALHSAIVRSRVEVVKYMMENGADPDEENKFGMVPLVHAIDQNNYEIVRLLVEVGGANVMRFDGGMNTMAQRAKSRKDTDKRIVELLEKKEAERKKEIEEEKAEKARKRKEAAAKRAAEKEAGGGAKKKGKKGKGPPKKDAPQDPQEEQEEAGEEGKEKEGGADKEGGAPAGEEEAGGGAAAAGVPNVPCSKVSDLSGGESLMFTDHPKWKGPACFEVWTCGLVDPLHPPDHSQHSSANWAELNEHRARLDELIAGFRPDHIEDVWQSFVITAETLEANGVGGEGEDVARALTKVLAGAEGPGGGCTMQARVVKEGGIPEQHLFHPRFFKTGHSWDNNKRSKVKFATNKLRALCKTNSVKHVQFENSNLSVVDPREFMVGRLRQGGGLLVVSLYDDSEEHYHHGSFGRPAGY